MLSVRSSIVSKIFIDTNILVYSIDQHDPIKNRRSRSIIRDVVDNNRAVISTQVLQELFVVGTTKLSIEPLLMKEIIHSLGHMETVIVGTEMIGEAIDTSILNSISFWDSLIVAAADNAQCEMIFTEDLNHGQVIRGVSIINPYQKYS
jgi:predicted nucleic acid-binding protein